MDNIKLDNKLQNFQSSLPPVWFKEYMEMLKKDIITEVSNKVMKNITRLLNKRMLEIITTSQFEEFNQLRDHSHPSPKNEVHIDSSDENYNTQENLYLDEKKQYKEITKAQPQENKSSNDIPIEYLDKQLLLCKRIIDIQLQTLKRNVLEEIKNCNKPGNVYSEERRQYKKEKKAVEHERNNSMSPKYLNKVALFLDKELSKKVAKIRLQEIALEEMRNTVDEDVSSNKSCHEEKKQTMLNTLKYIENELRMNCSILGHKVLGKTHVKDMFCSISDIDNISICSDISNVSDIQDDEHNFEMIQIPSNCDVNILNQNNSAITRSFQSESSHIALDNETLNLKSCKDDNGEGSRKSSSFEILSEIPSPSLSIYIEEDHFSVTENNSSTPNTNTIFSNDELNFRKNIPFVNDICEKVYNNMLNETGKCPSANLDERRDEAYSIVEEGLYPHQGMKLECNEHQSVNVNDLNIDVKSSHTSYPMKTQNSDTIQSEISLTQHSRSSQTDFSDFAQSFHSHTTSITDTYSSTGHNRASKYVTRDSNKNLNCPKKERVPFWEKVLC